MDICIYIMLALIVASLIMQFIRAKKREHFVAMVDPGVLPPDSQAKLHQIGSSFDPVFKSFRKLRIIKGHLDLLSEAQIAAWSAYQRISRIEMTVTASMLLFPVLAWKFCLG